LFVVRLSVPLAILVVADAHRGGLGPFGAGCSVWGPVAWRTCRLARSRARQNRQAPPLPRRALRASPNALFRRSCVCRASLFRFGSRPL